MKKIFVVALAWILMSTVSMAQEVNTQKVNLVEKTKTCIPTKECAAKAGMTLEECKKVCAGMSSADASTTKVASASLVSDAAETKKACCASMKECAAKMGMTVEECKAKCASGTNASIDDEDGDTKVASATLVNEVEEVTTTKAATKKCCKGASSCSKKKTN